MTRCGISLDLGWVYGLTVAIELVLCGHMTMYRLTVYGGGAFELCLPSLGILYQNCLLRRQILGRTLLLARLGVSWGEDHQIATVSDGGEQALVCEHDTMSGGSALRASLEV